MARTATLQDVADRCRVHRTTVALALRGDPRVHVDTKLAVEAAAAELGYRVNPLVAALMQARRSGREVKHVTLAYLTAHDTRYAWREEGIDHPNHFPGAKKRAAELGYNLEDFWFAEPRMTPERFSGILRARNISGVIVSRLPSHRREILFDWDNFSGVAIGLSLHSPVLHHVGEDHFENARHVVSECVRRGYKRLGFVFTKAVDYPQVADRWLGALEQNAEAVASGLKWLPPCLAHDSALPGPFMAWLKKQRPDVLVFARLRHVADWFRKARIKVPDDIGVVELISTGPSSEIAGIYHDPAQLGALAVDMVVGMMHRNERGVPNRSHAVLVPGQWIEGRTLPARF